MRITGEWLTQAIRAPGSPGYRDLLENCSEEDYQAILQGDAWIEGDNIEGMRLVRRTKE
jgi:hypothetical protein